MGKTFRRNQIESRTDAEKAATSILFLFLALEILRTYHSDSLYNFLQVTLSVKNESALLLFFFFKEREIPGHNSDTDTSPEDLYPFSFQVQFTKAPFHWLYA